MKYDTFIRGAALSALGVFASMAAFLITGKLITNALDRDAVGIFAVALVSADLVNLFTGMGLPVTMPKLAAEGDASHRRVVISSALAMQLLLLSGLALAAFIIRMLFSPGAFGWASPALRGAYQVLPLIALLFVVGGLRDLMMAMLAGLDRYAARAGGIVLASLAQVTLIYGLVYHFSSNLETLLLCMASAYALEVALLWACLGRFGWPRWHWPAYRDSVRFSLPLGVNQVLSFCYQRFDTVLVASLLGVGAAGVYDMVKRLPLVLNRILNAFLVPYLPHLSRLKAADADEEAELMLMRSYQIIAFLGYGGALTILAVQHFLIVALFNADYLGGTSVLGLLLITGCILLYTGLFGQTLIALGRGNAVLGINILAAVGSVLANLLLIPLLGMIGAGLAALLAALLCFILHYIYLRRAGLRVSLKACLLPHLILLLAVVPLFLVPDSPLWRLSSPALFGLGCLGAGVVRPADLAACIRILAPGRVRNCTTREG